MLKRVVVYVCMSACEYSTCYKWMVVCYNLIQLLGTEFFFSHIYKLLAAESVYI